MSDPAPKPDRRPPTAPLLDRYARRWLGYGVELAGVIGIFTWGGYQADEYFNTSPWWMLTASSVALISMMYLLVKEALSDPRFKNNDRADRTAGQREKDNKNP